MALPQKALVTASAAAVLVTAINDKIEEVRRDIPKVIEDDDWKTKNQSNIVDHIETATAQIDWTMKIANAVNGFDDDGTNGVKIREVKELVATGFNAAVSTVSKKTEEYVKDYGDNDIMIDHIPQITFSASDAIFHKKQRSKEISDEQESKESNINDDDGDDVEPQNKSNNAQNISNPHGIVNDKSSTKSSEFAKLVNTFIWFACVAAIVLRKSL